MILLYIRPIYILIITGLTPRINRNGVIFSHIFSTDYKKGREKKAESRRVAFSADISPFFSVFTRLANS